MDTVYKVFGSVRSVISEICRVLIAYPIFLIAVAFLALYAFLSCMYQVRDYAIDCMYDYMQKQEDIKKRDYRKNKARQKNAKEIESDSDEDNEEESNPRDAAVDSKKVKAKNQSPTTSKNEQAKSS